MYNPIYHLCICLSMRLSCCIVTNHDNMEMELSECKYGRLSGKMSSFGNPVMIVRHAFVPHLHLNSRTRA